VPLVSSLGIGFDIYDNGEVGGNNHLSLHYNNVLLSNFLLDPSTQIDLWESSADTYNHAHIVVDLVGQTVSVDLTPAGGTTFTAINNYSIPGLAPYEARVAFSGRTGAASANHDIENINVQFLSSVTPAPEPFTMFLLGSGLLGLIGFRRKLRK
jgi:hypothetical protein